jgi:hypothetical protein
MDSLHRCDYAKLAEAWNIRRVDVLRVLDAPSQVLACDLWQALVRSEGVFENVENFAIRAIADGVHT